MERHLRETVEVLVEGRSKKDKSEWKGRTRTNREVVFGSDSAQMGKLTRVTVERIFGKTFLGQTVS
jgi:tRNA-2-methylthio-N6-dimethylallyladenosine synthase